MHLTTVQGRTYYGHRTRHTAAKRAESRRARMAKYGKRGNGRKSWLAHQPSNLNGRSKGS